MGDADFPFCIFLLQDGLIIWPPRSLNKMEIYLFFKFYRLGESQNEAGTGGKEH